MMLRKTARNCCGSGQKNPASMRPQHDAAENQLARGAECRLDPASMRPQHDAAENISNSRDMPSIASGFNEAAA